MSMGNQGAPGEGEGCGLWAVGVNCTSRVSAEPVREGGGRCQEVWGPRNQGYVWARAGEGGYGRGGGHPGAAACPGESYQALHSHGDSIAELLAWPGWWPSASVPLTCICPSKLQQNLMDIPTAASTAATIALDLLCAAKVSIEGLPSNPDWPTEAEVKPLLKTRAGCPVSVQDIEADVTALLATGGRWLPGWLASWLAGGWAAASGGPGPKQRAAHGNQEMGMGSSRCGAGGASLTWVRFRPLGHRRVFTFWAPHRSPWHVRHCRGQQR